MVVRFAVDRRCAPVVGRLLRYRWRIFGSRAEDRWHGTGKVLDGNTVVTEWYRTDNEKESGKMYAESRRKRGQSYSESC